jgi:HlyD family secretion protein
MTRDKDDAAASTGSRSDVEVRHGDVLPPSDSAVVPAQRAPAVAAEQIAPNWRRPKWMALALLGIVILGTCAGGAYWWHTRQIGLLVGIVSGNGRIEADEIDIDTKFAGRIAEMGADEGDMVKAQQVLARMDTRDIEASL